MAIINLKSEKRLKQVNTGSENANTYSANDIVYDSAGSKFRKSDGTNWSDLTVPATVATIGSVGDVAAFAGSGADRGKIAKVANGSDAIEYSQVDEAIAGLFTITANGSTDYRFAGPGLAGTENDPTLYLIRGRRYQFFNNSGGHSLQFQSIANGTIGTGGQIYTTGIAFASDDDIDNGETATFEVMNDAPNILYYQCKSHTAMGGPIRIVDGTSVFRTIEVDTNGDDSANNTLDAGETLRFKKGTNITLAEAGGVITISATGGGATNLSATANGTSLTVESSTGNNVALPLADASNWGVMSDELFVKLNGIETSADVTDATNVNAAGAIMHTDLATKGQIVVGDGTGDATILGVGTNTHVLTADSTQASGVKWAQVPAAPIIMFATKTLSGNTAVHTELNSGSGGTLMVSDSSQNAAGSNAADGFMVNTASLNQTGTKARYEIISALAGKGFRFKADTTAIDSFGGQAQIAAATGNSDGISVSDSQKLVLLYTGSAWQYMVQSI